MMSASDTQAACTVPVSSHGSATARKAGAAFSATRVSSWAFPEHLSPKAESRQLFLAHACYASLTNKQAFWLISLFFNLFFFKIFHRPELLHSPQAMQEWCHMHQHRSGELHLFLPTWVHRLQLRD